MHITVVGAGTLGRVYGQRLAASGQEVSFVVRPGRVADTAPFILEQVNGARRRDVLERPDRQVEIPARTQVVLVAVRFEQLDAARVAAPGGLAELLRPARSAPIVVLTPLMPKQRRALEDALGR